MYFAGYLFNGSAFTSCRKVTLFEDSDNNVHLKNLSLHQASNEEEGEWHQYMCVLSLAGWLVGFAGSPDFLQYYLVRKLNTIDTSVF